MIFKQLLLVLLQLEVLFWLLCFVAHAAAMPPDIWANAKVTSLTTLSVVQGLKVTNPHCCKLVVCSVTCLVAT